MPETYTWPRASEFLDRTSEIERLEAWWANNERMPYNVYGRRRVGKSWLLRRFAHGKPSLFLVAERLPPGAQLSRFAEQISRFSAPHILPEIADVPALFRILYRLARDERILVVIDEFPWLVGGSEASKMQTLTAIQAVMEEERDASDLKLVLCGSSVEQMESLQSERNPLHGRLLPLHVRPIAWPTARIFLTDADPIDAFTKYTVSGGMPRYLHALSQHTLRTAIRRDVLNPDSGLFNEGRTIVQAELSTPDTYFAIVEQLAHGAQTIGDLARAVRVERSRDLSPYLEQLTMLRLIRPDMPIGAPKRSRKRQWVLTDPFLRFWFRYVFPFQAELEAGLDPDALWAGEIGPTLNHHASFEFEEVCRTHARATYGTKAPRIGRWWGNAANTHRRSGVRTTEEIDIVGMTRAKVTLLGEARWRNKPMSVSVLRDIDEYKTPALRDAGLTVLPNPKIILYSRGGYTDGLTDAASGNPDVDLVDVPTMLGRDTFL